MGIDTRGVSCGALANRHRDQVLHCNVNPLLYFHSQAPLCSPSNNEPRNAVQSPPSYVALTSMPAPLLRSDCTVVRNPLAAASTSSVASAGSRSAWDFVLSAPASS